MPTNNTGFDPRKFAHTSNGLCDMCRIVDAMRDMAEYDGNLDGAVKWGAEQLGIQTDNPGAYIPQVKGVAKIHYVSKLLEPLMSNINVVGSRLVLRKKELVDEAYGKYRVAFEDARAATQNRWDRHLVREEREKAFAAEQALKDIKCLSIGGHEDMLAAKEELAYQKKALMDKYKDMSLPQLLGIPEAKFLRQLLRKRAEQRDPESFWVDIEGKEQLCLYAPDRTMAGTPTMAELLGEEINQWYSELSVEKLLTRISC